MIRFDNSSYAMRVFSRKTSGLASGKKPLDIAGLIPQSWAMSMEADLIRVSDAYCAAKPMKRGRLSTILLESGKALDAIASGSTLTVRSWQGCMGWLSQNWPEGTDWPAGVDRPDPASFSGFVRARRKPRLDRHTVAPAQAGA